MKGKLSSNAKKILSDRDASQDLMDYVVRYRVAGTQKKRAIKVKDTEFEVSSGSAAYIDSVVEK